MFIREIKKKFNKKSGEYEYIQHRLVESIRTEYGPRQHVLLNLGSLSIPQQQYKTLANLIEANLTNSMQESLFQQDVPEQLICLARHFADIIIQKRLQIAKRKLNQTPQTIQDKQEPHYVEIDTNSITSSCSRTIGAEHIVLTYLKQLDFFTILQECGFSEKQQNYAAAQICARVVHPASELETARWLRENSALGELLDADFSHISDQSLHRVSDMLCMHKDAIEKQLCQNTNELFGLDSKLILYDLTNTYFESPKRGSRIATYGKNKQKRNDCPQITLALVVDSMGFPKRSKILEGNVSEPGTLWNILEELDEQFDGNTHRPKTIVIDAGIATEDNIDKLKADPRFEYVAISRKKNFKYDIFSDAKPHTLSMNNEKQLLVQMAHYNGETFLLCKSPDRSRKDEAILCRRREKFEKELSEINNGLKKSGTRKQCSYIFERIGRIKERYKIGNLYKIEVEEENDIAVEISWKYHADKVKEFGEYIIRTSRCDLMDEDISLIHRSLTMIESAFRWLKSDLGLRPNFHQLDRRMGMHANISVFAYFVLAPILNRLQWGGTFISSAGKTESHDPWDKPYGLKRLVGTMASQTRITTSFDCKDGSRMDVRTTMDPSAEQMDVYRRLKVKSRPLNRIIVKK